MQIKSPPVVLYLLGKKGLAVLTGLIDAGHTESILAIVVATDKAMQKDYSEEILEIASQNKIPTRSKSDNILDKQMSKVALAVGWRWIIDEMRHETIIVFHDSLLPRFRGFAPLVAQLLKGERQIGATALIATKEYDKGNIIYQEAVEIDYPIKVEQAIEALLPLYQTLANQVFQNLINNKEIAGVPQNETEATYSVWRDEQDLKLNWEESSVQIKRFVDATGFPYKGAYTVLGGKRVVIEEVEELEDLNFEFRHVGKTVRFQDKCPVIICGKGLILIKLARWFHSGEEIADWPKFRMRFN